MVLNQYHNLFLLDNMKKILLFTLIIEIIGFCSGCADEDSSEQTQSNNYDPQIMVLPSMNDGSPIIYVDGLPMGGY